MRTRAYRFVVFALCLSHRVDAVSPEFESACHNGAEARVEFHVVDDMGKPVHNAKVDVFFDMTDRSKGRRIVGNTDTNGVFVAEAKTGGILEVEVTGDHHYRSKRKISFIAMGSEHNVSGGRWQPWGAKRMLYSCLLKIQLREDHFLQVGKTHMN